MLGPRNSVWRNLLFQYLLGGEDLDFHGNLLSQYLVGGGDLDFQSNLPVDLDHWTF